MIKTIATAVLAIAILALGHGIVQHNWLTGFIGGYLLVMLSTYSYSYTTAQPDPTHTQTAHSNKPSYAPSPQPEADTLVSA